jgi:gluconolactonase
MWMTALGCLCAAALLAQAPAQAPAPGGVPPVPAAPQQGPGVQAPQDARYAEWIASRCKNPPVARGGGAPNRGAGGPPAAGGANRGPAAAAPAGPPTPRDYTIKEIPGVIAGGQKWKSIWTGTGNNADGIIATKDGGILVAQNTDSKVMEIDKNNKVSFPYTDTNTGGAVSMNKKGALFLVSRGFPAKVLQLAPKRQVLADMYNGEPLDCIGGVINDLTADSKGGVYFTMGGLFYANPKGVVTKYGDMLQTNGVVLSPDEKTLYVTTRGVVAFDVQPDGSLTKQRQFYMGMGGDGTTVDAAGRVYTTTNGADGVVVIAPDGKVLGSIPTPLNFITVAFSGKDKKTLYGVANNQRYDEIFTIQMIAQGYKGRAK